MRTIIVVLAAIVFPAASFGQGTSEFDSGHDLLAACEALTDGPESISTASLQEKLDWHSQSEFCYGYIRGVTDWNRSYEAWLKNVLYKPIFCIGDDQVKIDRLIKIAITYMHDHPEELDKKGIAVLESAFSEAYPCSTVK